MFMELNGKLCIVKQYFIDSSSENNLRSVKMPVQFYHKCFPIQLAKNVVNSQLLLKLLYVYFL